MMFIVASLSIVAPGASHRRHNTGTALGQPCTQQRVLGLIVEHWLPIAGQDRKEFLPAFRRLLAKPVAGYWGGRRIIRYRPGSQLRRGWSRIANIDELPVPVQRRGDDRAYLPNGRGRRVADVEHALCRLAKRQ